MYAAISSSIPGHLYSLLRQALVAFTPLCPPIFKSRNLEISTAPTEVKLQEPAYSQALNQNKIDRQGIKRVRQAERQTDSQTAMVVRVERTRLAWGRG